MEIIIYFLPAIVSLLVAATIWSRRNLTLSMTMLAWSMCINGAYLSLSALITFSGTEPRLLVWSYIGLGFLVPTMQFVIVLITWSLKTMRQRFLPSYMLYNIIPASTGFLLIIGYGLVGIDAAVDYLQNGRMIPLGLSPGETMIYKVFEFLSVDYYNAVVLLCALACVCYMIYALYKTDFSLGMLFRFLFAKGPIRPLHLFVMISLAVEVLSILRLSGDRSVMSEHITYYCSIYLLQALVIGSVGFLAPRLSSPCIYLSRRHPEALFEDLPLNIQDPHSVNAGSSFSDDESDSYRTLNLRDELKVLMREYTCYRQVGFNRYGVSMSLSISRKGLDRLVKLLHNVTYEEYVLIQRIEYMKRYTAKYPEESMVEVAMVCGFPSVAAMKEQEKLYRALFNQTDSSL